jgi:hypothetical protein
MAWSPNGRILAAMTIPDPGAASNLSNPNFVTLYDTATGRPLETLPTLPNAKAPTNPIGAGSFLRWSADGSRLLVYNQQLDMITILRLS